MEIKTKVQYPFIYFLYEPNFILVYQIRGEKYVKVSDFHIASDLELFELHHIDDFESFSHIESESVEGRGFCLDSSEINNIVEEINKHIQERRNMNDRENQFGAVHLITSESAAGSLRVGLAASNMVIGFPDSFSIGPLCNLDQKTGQLYRKEWLAENINDEQEDYEYENKITNTLREIEDIPSDVPIYIWFGDNVDEQTGLAYYLYLLREKTNDLYLMNTTMFYEKYHAIDDEPMLRHSSQLDSEKFNLFFENNEEFTPLSDKLRIQYHVEWKKLSQSKEMLRIWSGDEITGTQEDYYDQFIIETLERLHEEQASKDFIQTGSVIIEVFTRLDAYVNLYFLEYRIRHLVYCGVLELKGIPKSMRHYRIKLR